VKQLVKTVVESLFYFIFIDWLLSNSEDNISHSYLAK